MPTEPTRRATRADVARLAGVSPAVVSFTLNGGPRPVARETAKRVLEAVAQLGYTPNAAARALSMGSSGVIGLIVHDITNPFYSRIAATVQAEADVRGMSVIVATTLDDRSRALPLMRAFDARHVDGIIVTTYLSRDAVAEASRLRARIVQLESDGPIPGVVRLDTDLRRGSAAAVRHLVDLGHERIAYVGGRSPIDAKIGPWEESHRERGVEPGRLEIVELSRRGGYEGMRAVLADETPTAVYAGSDMVALGILRAIREAGLRVPEDISVMGFDDTEDAEYAAPALSTVHVPVADMARDAVRALTDPEPIEPVEPVERMYPTRLVLRDSTAPPRR